MKSQESTQKDQEQKSKLIVTTAGKPFQSVQSAGLVMANKKLDPTRYEVVTVAGGFAIAPKGDMAPEVRQMKPGTTIETGNEDPNASADVVAPRITETPAEKVYWGKFAPKSKESDTDAVVLAVQGDVIQIERDKAVPLPERYWDCARNATYPQYKQLPGISRKIVAKIRLYNFEIIREGTWAEFEAERRAGTKKTREDMEREQQMNEAATTATMAQV